MALTVNSNFSSLNAQRNLTKTQMSLQQSLQRLSSGLRINSAKDDAAGLGTSNRITAQIRGLNQATRNANDGISLAQTAEGALGEVTTNLQRLRELAVQSANASNSTQDRAALQEEASQLLDQINQTADQTDFNGIKLLDGSFKAQVFQVGANANQNLSITMNSAKTDKLGTADVASVSSRGSSALDTSAAPAMVQGDLVINGVIIGASVGASDTASSENNAGSAIAKAAAINAQSTQSGVTATVNQNVAAGNSMTGAATNGNIYINGVRTATVFTTTDTAATRSSMVTAINAISAQTGVTATDTGEDTGGVKLTAADGRNVAVGFESIASLTAAATGINGATLASGNASGYTVYYGGYTLSSAKEVKVEQGTGTGNIANAGLTAGTYTAQTAYVSTTSTANAISAGDLRINGVLIGASVSAYDTASSASKSASAIAKAAAVNAVSAQTGVTAKANAAIAAGSSMTAAALTGNITINGVTTANISTTTNAADSRKIVMDAINAISGQTGVVAADTNADTTGVKLTAADGRNIVVAFSTLTAAATGVVAAGTTNGSITLSSAKTFTIERGTTITATATNFGLAVGSYGGTRSGQALNTVDLSTTTGATNALTAIDNALKQIDGSRSTLGAVQNRFEATISNLTNTSENLAAARGRILDADFASETASLTKNQILQQAGIAMLGQANQLPQQVLSLLRG